MWFRQFVFECVICLKFLFNEHSPIIIRPQKKKTKKKKKETTGKNWKKKENRKNMKKEKKCTYIMVWVFLDNHRSALCSIWNFNRWWRTVSSVTLMINKIARMSLPTALYCRICQMFLETFSQILISHISGQNRASELL